MRQTFKWLLLLLLFAEQEIYSIAIPIENKRHNLLAEPPFSIVESLLQQTPSNSPGTDKSVRFRKISFIVDSEKPSTQPNANGAPRKSFLMQKMNEQPLFSGQIIGGRKTHELSEDITPEAIEAMVACAFYVKNHDSCYPSDPVTPCRYCRVTKTKYVGEAACPPPESFPAELRDLYEWRIKPIKKEKHKIRSVYVCMTYSLPPGFKRPQEVSSGIFYQSKFSVVVLFFVALFTVNPPLIVY